MKVPRKIASQVEAAAIKTTVVKKQLPVDETPAKPPEVVAPESFKVTISIPGLRVNTIGNTRRHWRVEAKEAKKQRALALMHCRLLGNDVRDKLLKAKSLKVTYVRTGVRKLDTTNCVGAFKRIQDSLAEWLGVDDGSEWYCWQWPVQKLAKHYECAIELEAIY